MFDADTKTKFASPGANRYFPLHFIEARTLAKQSTEKSHGRTQQSEIPITWQLQLGIPSPLYRKEAHDFIRAATC